jgi:alkylation response protein AidB-like acyl-CoA dehydrogenase
LTVTLDFTLGDDLVRIQQAARKACRSGDRRPIRPSREAVEESWRVLADLGALAHLVPKSFGGSEGGLLPLTLVLEELTGAGLGANLAVLTAVVTILIARHGSTRLREGHLPAVASGSRRYCLPVSRGGSRL